MRRDLQLLSEIALCVAGAVVVRNVTSQRRARPSAPDESTRGPELIAVQRAVGDLEARLERQESLTEKRLAEIETRLSKHAVVLGQLPRTQDIITAIEQLLRKTMAPIEDRLAAHAEHIRLLQTTTSQTDDLLARVLEGVKETLANRPQPG